MTTQPQPEALPPLPTPDANRAEWDGGWRQYHDQHDLLPDQWDDEKPDSIVPLFTADQMRAYATEHAARLHAECEALRKSLALVQQHHATAWNRGHTMGMAANRQIAREAQEAVARDAWGNTQLTEALLAAEAECEALRAVIDAFHYHHKFGDGLLASTIVRECEEAVPALAAIDAARAAKEQSNGNRR